MRTRHFALVITLVTTLSCTSRPPKGENNFPARTTAGSASDDVGMCAQEYVPALYQSLTAATCNVNYAWELIGGPIASNDTLNCAAIYMGGGGVAVAAAGGLAKMHLEAWAPNLQGERTVLSRNTPAFRKSLSAMLDNPFLVSVDQRQEIRTKALQRMLEGFGNLRNDFATSVSSGSDRVEKILAKYPNNYVRYHYLAEAGRLDGTALTVTKGPNRLLLQASRWAFRLGILSTGVGVVMIAADAVLSATPTACDENIDAFYDADSNDHCNPRKVAGPNTIKFLQMDPEKQLSTLQENPMLCPAYKDIADTQAAENKKKFGTNEISYVCTEGKIQAQLSADDGSKTDVELSGLKARMQSFGQSIDVEYLKNENGRMSVSSITWRSAYGGTRPVRYKFPADMRRINEPRFANILQQVARNTLALETSNLFNANCH